MANTENRFRAEDFYSAIAQTVASRGITWKQVSKETGISASTLTRMAQGRQPDASSLAVLSAWARLNPADYVGKSNRVGNAEPLAVISALLRADSRLKPEAAKALEAIIQTAYESLRDPKRKK